MIVIIISEKRERKKEAKKRKIEIVTECKINGEEKERLN